MLLCGEHPALRVPAANSLRNVPDNLHWAPGLLSHVSLQNHKTGTRQERDHGNLVRKLVGDGGSSERVP